MGNAKILITRQQYDEALEKLPDPQACGEDSIEIPVDARSLLKALRFRSTVSGTDDWPMTVLFDKIQPDLVRLRGIALPGPCWRLAPQYKIV